MADDNSNINEPEKKHVKKEIIFFNSFDEAEEYGLKKMASHSHEERLANLETIRKRVYSHLLLPNGEWPRMRKVITIERGMLK
jgi:hypothetical protein